MTDEKKEPRPAWKGADESERAQAVIDEALSHGDVVCAVVIRDIGDGFICKSYFKDLPALYAVYGYVTKKVTEYA